MRTAWVQATGPGPYLQRNLPTGGVELQCLLGGVPRIVGPLTIAAVEVLPAGSVVVGVRFWPGAAAGLLGLPADELVDLGVSLEQLWGHRAVRLGDDPAATASASGPVAALEALQDHLAAKAAIAPRDPLNTRAVRRLMPWQEVDVGALSTELVISTSQLRRRFVSVVGLGPKPLQRTLRFQGYLALAQAAATDGGGTRSCGPRRRGGVCRPDPPRASRRRPLLRRPVDNRRDRARSRTPRHRSRHFGRARDDRRRGAIGAGLSGVSTRTAGSSRPGADPRSASPG